MGVRGGCIRAEDLKISGWGGVAVASIPKGLLFVLFNLEPPDLHPKP